MTKTILIGDTHLKNGLILPIIDNIIENHSVKQVIFMGDYLDTKILGQQDNVKLYAKDLIYLVDWKKKVTEKGISCTFLIGNHDIFYYLGIPTSFTLTNQEAFETIGDTLEELDLQIAFQLDDYLISHAGYNFLFDVEDWHFSRLSLENEDELIRFANAIGPMRGGQDLAGSPVWAHIEEIEIAPNPEYPKQIVGHTPQPSIDLSKNIIGIDTFAIDEEMNFYGNGDILLYDSESKVFSVIATNWKSVETFDRLKKYIGGK